MAGWHLLSIMLFSLLCFTSCCLMFSSALTHVSEVEDEHHRFPWATTGQACWRKELSCTLNLCHSSLRLRGTRAEQHPHPPCPSYSSQPWFTLFSQAQCLSCLSHWYKESEGQVMLKRCCNVEIIGVKLELFPEKIPA